MPYQYYENQYLEGQIMQNRSQIAENQFCTRLRSTTNSSKTRTSK